ncbi:MAG: hypothetical protein R6X23_12885 [Acidimicrobiia bacterium]
MARQFQDRVAIIGFAGRDDLEPMRAFVDRYDFGFVPHAVDADGSLWSAFGVRGQPAWVFVGADGSREVVYGAVTEEDLIRRLEALEAA